MLLLRLRVMLLRLRVMLLRLRVMPLMLGVMPLMLGVMLLRLGVMMWPRAMRLGIMLIWLILGIRGMLLGTGVILIKLLSQILGQMLYLLISILLRQNEPGPFMLCVMLLPRLVGSVWLTVQVEARVMVGRVFRLRVLWLLTIVFNQLNVFVAMRQGLLIDWFRIAWLSDIAWSSSGLVIGPKPWFSRLLPTTRPGYVTE